jgi:hypothetical protein
MLIDIEDDYFEQGKELTKEDAKKELLQRFHEVKKMANRVALTHSRL